MDSAPDGDLDIEAALPFAGAELPATETGGAHLDLYGAVMYPYIDPSARMLLTEADILAMAQLNGYVDIDLSPSRVPEPGVLSLAALVLGIEALRRRGAREGRCTVC